MSEIGQKIIAEVRKVAAANPDYIYERVEGSPNCVYVRDGKPSCLIGHALWNLGLIDIHLPADLNYGGIHRLAPELNIWLDDAELTWLMSAQSAQDTRKTWAEAVEYAGPSW